MTNYSKKYSLEDHRYSSLSIKKCYVICLFGDKFDGMLLTLLYSLQENTNNCDCFVFHQDNSPMFEDIKKAFTNVEFVKTSFNFENNYILRISSKTLIWSYALEYLYNLKRNSYDYALFLDVDTLVLKDPWFFLSNLGVLDADVVITVKDKEIWPINTGVILTKISERSSCFFNFWKKYTFKLFESADSIQKATSSAYPYGGVDQMSMHNIINYSAEKNNFTEDSCDVSIKKIHCANFNQTNSTAITNDTFIIHYKSGWQRVLIDGKNFTKLRTKEDSSEMYNYYLEMYKSSVRYLKAKIQNTHYNYSNCGIYLPMYTRFNNSTIGLPLYYTHYFRNKICYYFELLQRALKKLQDYIK